MEKPLEAWEGMQRQGQDIVERLTQGFTGLLHGHMKGAGHDEGGLSMWPWPWPGRERAKSFDRVEFKTRRASALPEADGSAGANIGDLRQRLGQAGAEFGARVGGMVQNVVQHLPVMPFQKEFSFSGNMISPRVSDSASPGHVELRDEGEEAEGFEDVADGDEFKSKGQNRFHKPQGSVTVTATYDSRTRDIESSVVARGDKWRAEVSIGGSSSGNTSVPLFLLQLCPFFFVRDTLLLPIHSSDQHRLWYGFDKKNGVHSLCPVVWSKQSRWHLLSMICVNPLTCTFLDLHFPNGQVTYAAGEGLTSSAFVPAFGGLIQAQCRYPGEKKLSFSCKNRWGTCVTPSVQWPDRSFSVRMVQPLAWQWTGFIFQPTTQLSVTPTFGGRNAGWNTELVHTMKDKFSVTCGCSLAMHPSAFASVSVHRSKWNENFGTSGLVLRVDSPLENVSRTSFSIQLSSGIEF